MRRYASIDFLRGLAIFLMLVLHVVMTTFNMDVLDHINDLPILNLAALLVLPFLGGFAGFFLLVSAIGNSISMQRHLQKGKSVKALAIRQVMGGVLLLVFAVLSEALIGYHGTLGDAIRLNSDPWATALWRGYHMETIHTIAWCVIVNGLVQAYLARNGRWKDVKYCVKIYVIAAIVVVAATYPVWELVKLVIPGYPHATYEELGLIAAGDPNAGRRIQYPVPGVTRWWEYITLFLATPLAGHPEPIFPYLAISFLGSIVGIYLAQDSEDVPKDFPKKFMHVGFVMFWVGLVGVIVELVGVMDAGGVDALLDTYRLLWDHRGWVPDGRAGTSPVGWLFQFLALNGASICLTLLIIRTVEFRGKGKPFGEKTLYIRRYGIVAFSVYTYQFVYFFGQRILSLLTGADEAYATFTWSGVAFIWAFTLGVFTLVLWAWEKVRYAGSLEWCIGTLGVLLIPARKAAVQEKKPRLGALDGYTGATGTENGENEDKEPASTKNAPPAPMPERKWWEPGLIDVEGALRNPEWLNVVAPEAVAHGQQADSKLAWKVSLLGLFSLVPLLGLFMSLLSMIALGVARSAMATEGKNTYNQRAQTLAIVGLCAAVAWVVLGLVATPASLGIPL